MAGTGIYTGRLVLLQAPQCDRARDLDSGDRKPVCDQSESLGFGGVAADLFQPKDSGMGASLAERILCVLSGALGGDFGYSDIVTESTLKASLTKTENTLPKHIEKYHRIECALMGIYPVARAVVHAKEL